MSYGSDELAREDYSTEAAGPSLDREVRAAKLSRDHAASRGTGDRGPIEAALDRCDEAAASLAEIAENLAHRLAPILGPDRPEPALGEVRQEGDSSPVVGRLDQLRDRLDDARAVLLRATRRIEL